MYSLFNALAVYSKSHFQKDLKVVMHKERLMPKKRGTSATSKPEMVRLILGYLDDLLDIVTGAEREEIVRIEWDTHVVTYARSYMSEDDEEFALELFAHLDGIKRRLSSSGTIRREVDGIFDVSVQAWFDYKAKEAIDHIFEDFCRKIESFYEGYLERYKLFRQSRSITDLVHETLMEIAGHAATPEDIVEDENYHYLFERRQEIDGAQIADRKKLVEAVFHLFINVLKKNREDHSAILFLIDRFIRDAQEQGVQMSHQNKEVLDETRERIHLANRVQLSTQAVGKDIFDIHIDILGSSDSYDSVRARVRAVIAKCSYEWFMQSPRQRYKSIERLMSLWDGTLYDKTQSEEIAEVVTTVRRRALRMPFIHHQHKIPVKAIGYAVTIFLIVALFWTIFQIPITTEKVIEIEVPQTLTVTEKEAAGYPPSSFATYMADPTYHRKRITLVGYPEYVHIGNENLGVYREILWDDEGRNISLVGLTDTDRRMVRASDAGQQYAVTGIYDRFTPEIEVHSMVPVEPQEVAINRTVQTMVREPRLLLQTKTLWKALFG